LENEDEELQKMVCSMKGQKDMEGQSVSWVRKR